MILLATLATVTILAMPNPDITPGLIRPLSVKTICSTAWGTDVRHVDERMKRHVFAAYGIAWADRGKFEVDHLIPRSIGGADSLLDLWPQPLAEAKHLKDRAEVAAWRMVCAGTLPLRTAQEAFRTDWRAAYLAFVGPLP